MSPIRLLLIQANPRRGVPLDLDVEQRNLQEAIQASRRAVEIAVHVLPAGRIADLPVYLRRYEPHIVHFGCHGDGDGGLHLTAPGDQDDEVLGAEDLAEIVRAYQAEAAERLRLAVAAGCWTEATAERLANEVDCAVGFAGDVPDEDLAQVFSPQFYAALADDRSAANAAAAAGAVLRGRGKQDTAEMLRVYSRGGEGALRPSAWGRRVLSAAHMDYLKSWFDKPWANVPLAEILGEDGGERREISLLDVYVPLPVDFSLVFQMQGGRIVDWWVKPGQGEGGGAPARPEPGDLEQAAGGRSFRQRVWPALGAGEVELQEIVDEIQCKYDERAVSGDGAEDGEHPWIMEAHDAASVQGRFVLLGEPGSGKSSFLRHLALCLAGELRRRAGDGTTPANAGLPALRDWLLGPFTPIYVELRDLVAAVFPPLRAADDAPLRLPDVEDFWRYAGRLAGPDLTRMGGELRWLCDAGEAILLLDGLDEVPEADSADRRRQIQALIASLGKRYPDLRIVVAGRPHAYRRGEWALPGFGVAELRPLSLDRLGELARALFPAVLEADGVRQADDFIAAVRQQLKDKRIEPSLYANPLFFTLLAGLWLDGDRGQRLPETRAELYRRSVDLLLTRWTRRRLPDESVAEKLKLSPAQLRGVMETLACMVHEQSTPGQDAARFHRKELLAVLDEVPGADIRQAAEHLSRQVGLLTSPAHGQYYFTHRSFQEHLAACELICAAPDRHAPPIAADRLFPQGIVQRLLDKPELWENVARLAVDELLAQGRGGDLGRMLVACVRPYLECGQAPGAALLALAVAREQKLFSVDPYDVPIDRQDFETLRQAALKLLVDWERVEPEGRSVAGELLGARPEHDTRRGVGLRRDGLPDIDWVEAPEYGAGGEHEFIYGDGERRVEPTFWMARYPVTYLQFQAFVDAGDGYRNPRWWEGLDASKGDRLAHLELWRGGDTRLHVDDAPEDDRPAPVEQRFPFWNHPRDSVTWYEAVAFCRWLSDQAEERRDLLPAALRRQGWRISLPTEWQWEKAARGHSGRIYPWGGDEYRSGYANVDEVREPVPILARQPFLSRIGGYVHVDEVRQPSGREADGPHYLRKSSAAGMYPQGASLYGVCDLSGNVWEWCLNEYEHPDRIQEAGSEYRVLRGGSWNLTGDYAAAVVRHWFSPDLRDFDWGFRVVACAAPVA